MAARLVEWVQRFGRLQLRSGHCGATFARRLWLTLPQPSAGTVEEEARQPDAWWVDLIGSTVEHPRGGLWIGGINDEPLGMLFGRLSPDSQLLSVGAMWVAPPGRNKGI